MAGISGRYLVDIENDGQAPSLHILSSIVRILDVSLDQFIFPDRKIEKGTERRQLEALLDGIDDKDLIIVTDTVRGIQKAREAGE